LSASACAARASAIPLARRGHPRRNFRSLPLATFRLTATDHVWSTGDGAQVTGTMTDLFLLLTGRTAWIGHLHGPGAADLRRAIAAGQPLNGADTP
jgi:hypothetical protein